MIRKLLSFLSGKGCCARESAPVLPDGFEAAPPIENPKLRELLEGPDITADGGVHLNSDGRPLRPRQAIQNR